MEGASLGNGKRECPRIFSSMALACTFILLPSCGGRPEGVLSDDKMVSVMADMELAEAYLQTQGGSRQPEARGALTEDIFRRNGITQAEFDSTMSWYASHSDRYQELYARTEKELKKRRLRNKGLSDPGVAASDMWPYGRMAMFSTTGIPSLGFSVAASDMQKGDRLTFLMRMQTASKVSTVFGVEYEDGSVGYTSAEYPQTNRLELLFQTDTAKVVKRIFGNLTLEEKGDLPVWGDSITLSRVPLDSNEYYLVNRQKIFNPPVRKVKKVEEKTDTDSVTSKEKEIEEKEVPKAGTPAEAPPQKKPNPGMMKGLGQPHKGDKVGG